MIKEFKLIENKNPIFIKSNLATFKYKGKEKSWELIASHDSVAILIYHKEKKEFIFVKQFRAPLYTVDNIGMSLELCAGLVDKDCSLKQIAKEEILEECGYNVDIKNIKNVTTFLSSPGRTGSSQHLFYTEVTDKDKVNEGGGIHDEDIEVIYMSPEEIEKLIYNNSSPLTSGMAFMILWWKEKRKNNSV